MIDSSYGCAMWPSSECVRRWKVISTVVTGNRNIDEAVVIVFPPKLNVGGE